MKRLIYQVYVGDKSKLYDHCTASVKAYADKHNIDYILQTTPQLLIRPNPFTSGRSKEAVDRLGYLPIFEKENAFDYLGEYDEVCIIDSDVYIRENASNIFDTRPAQSVFSACIEASMPITEAYKRKIMNYSMMQYGQHFPELGINWHSLYGFMFCNMGVMLFTKQLKKYIKANTAKEFLQRPEFQPFIDGVGAWKWSTDQTLLNTWIHMDRIPWSNLSWKFNGLFGANTRLDECEFVHFFLKDKLPNKGEDVKTLMDMI